MVDFALAPTLALISMDAQTEQAIYCPSAPELLAALDRVRSGAHDNHCIECEIRLRSDIDGELSFIRANHPRMGTFVGWIVQLTCEDFSSFVLANMDDGQPLRCPGFTEIELFGCTEGVDSRCLLSQCEVQLWLEQELCARLPANVFRWVDFSMAISV